MKTRRIRVLIATTEGLVEIRRLSVEAAALGRSLACIAGTTQIAGISESYRGFVDGPQSIVDRGPYRIDLASNIDVGNSWQLGVLAAHALFASGRLAMEGEPADAVLIASGGIEVSSGRVLAVAHLGQKLDRARARIAAERAVGNDIYLAIPEISIGELKSAAIDPVTLDGTHVCAISQWPELLTRLGTTTGLALPEQATQAGAQGGGDRIFSLSWYHAVAASIATLLLAVGIVQMRAPTASIAASPAFRDCATCPELIALSGGTFMMGADNVVTFAGERDDPKRSVKIANAFAIGRFEVTVGEFDVFVRATGYALGDDCLIRDRTKDSGRFGGERAERATFRRPGFEVTERHPAACISIDDAKAYLTWLSQSTRQAYRLPNEAEWEFSARAGTTTRFDFGDTVDGICAHARFADLATDFPYRSTCDSGRPGPGTLPVGSLHPNAWGIYDMHGNVAEFVDGCLDPDWQIHGETGAVLRTGGHCKVPSARGSGWAAIATAMRVSRRTPIRSASRRLDTFGFRVARDLTPDEVARHLAMRR
jgi:formylglycine-generating enzyme